jgi:hypothetical protein
MRKQQVLRGEKPWAVYGEWNTPDFSFTISKLRQPNEAEKTILAAISRAAREIPPEPGDRIRDVGTHQSAFDYGPYIPSGFLPLEPIPPPSN